MKIVHVIDSFFPDSLGGTENYVLYISKEMQRLGHQVCVVSSKKERSENYIYEGINVYRFKISEYASYKEVTGKAAPEGLALFEEIIKQLSPDIVHFHSFNRAINTYHLRAVHSLRIKTVFTAHQTGIFCIKGSLINEQGNLCDGEVGRCSCLKCYLCHLAWNRSLAFLLAAGAQMAELTGLLHLLPFPAFAYLKYNRKKELKAISHYADCNIAISRWVYEAYLRNGVKNIRLVEQGTNPAFCQKVKLPTLNSNDKRLRLLFVGRQHYVKGLDVLCEALQLLDTDKLTVVCAVVSGGGDYGRKIKTAVTALPHYEWYENVPSEKVRALMHDCDILVLPSRNEMSPLVVLEALACQLPVLGSSIPPITDIIKDGKNGLIFKVNNIASFVEKLQLAMGNPGMIDNLRNNIRPARTLNNVAADLIKIYQEL